MADQIISANAPANFVLSLDRLRLTVQLGYTAGERARPQIVCFSVRMKFPKSPEACFDDELEHTVCYGEISDVLREVCNGEFKTVEALAYKCYAAVRSLVPKEIAIAFRALKEKPPIAELEGGASVTLGDWEAGVSAWQR